MTLKKSMISIAAAGVIAATITGCGSSGGTSYAPITTTGIQSSVQAIDGYIYNGLVEGYYLQDDNKTIGKVALVAKKTTKDVSTGVVTLGESTYSLPTDANTSVRNGLKFFKISNAVSSSVGNTFTPATYIEADGVNGFDANDTALDTTTIYAPANSKILSPLTSLIYQANSAALGSETVASTIKGDLNATTLKGLENNATVIAKNLGLGDVNLLTADPIALASSNPALKLVTALLKDAPATAATKILSMTTPATTLSATIQATIDAGLSAKADTFAKELKALVDSGAVSAADIAKINLEKSVATGKYSSLAAPSLKGKFVVSGLTVDGADSSALVEKGAKLKLTTTETVDINMTASTNDVNVSNTSFNLYVSFAGAKANQASDTNISTAFAVKIPFDLNLTSGTVATAGIAAGAKTPYQVKADDGSQIKEYDVNATTLGLVAGDITAASNVVKVNLANIVTKLQAAADANVSAKKKFDGTISGVQIFLEDSKGMIVGAKDKDTAWPLAKGSFKDTGLGKIIATDAIKILANDVVDSRSDALPTAANGAPSFTSLDGNASGSEWQTDYANAAKASRVVPAVTVLETGENNNTLTVGTLPSWIKFDKASYVSTTTGTVDVNLTTDTNLSIGDTNTTVKFTVTDEFGKKNAADGNISFFYNATPTITAPSGVVKTGTSYDVNGTALKNATTKTLTFTIANVMGGIDSNDTVINDSNISKKATWDINTTTGTGTVVIDFTDFNGTSGGTNYDINASFQDAKDGANTVHKIDLNVSF